MNKKVLQFIFGYIRSLVVGPLVILNVALGMISIIIVFDYISRAGNDLFEYLSGLLPYMRNLFVTDTDILFWYALAVAVSYAIRIIIQPYVGFYLGIPWKHKLWVSSVYYFVTAAIIAWGIDLGIALDFVGFSAFFLCVIAILDTFLWFFEFGLKQNES